MTGRLHNPPKDLPIFHYVLLPEYLEHDICHTARDATCTAQQTLPIHFSPLISPQIGDAIYQRNLSSGFAVPPLIRFTGGPEQGGEAGYISTGQGGPRIHFNVEDHLSRSSGKLNVPFQVSVT